MYDREPYKRANIRCSISVNSTQGSQFFERLSRLFPSTGEPSSDGEECNDLRTHCNRQIFILFDGQEREDAFATLDALNDDEIADFAEGKMEQHPSVVTQQEANENNIAWQKKKKRRK